MVKVSCMPRLSVILIPILAFRVHAATQGGAAISGCYRFDRPYFNWFNLGAANPRRGATDSSAIVRLSSRAESRFRHPGLPGFDIQPMPFTEDSTTARRWLQFSHWTAVDSNTVEIVWRNGLYGPVFRLVVRGDTLRGQVRFTTDVVGAEPPPEPAMGVRMPCPP